jgi:guanyl-specific ribonuclease Sa
MYGNNNGAYDRYIRQNNSVSYPTNGENTSGVAIYTVEYRSISNNAKRIIGEIRAGNPPNTHGRDGATFGNGAGYLPTDGTYAEYSAADRRLNDRGAVVLIHDSQNDRFYITVTHYRGWMRGQEERNAFYRVKAIPFEKAANGGGPKTITGANY